jgi:hypothetical protein
MPGKRITRLRAASAAALLSLSLAAPAFADHGDWGRDGRRGYDVHRHDRSCDRDHRDWDRRDHRDWDRRDYRGGWNDRYRDGNRGYWNRRDHRHRGHDRYDCRRCGRRWSDERSFHGHLSNVHHVPFAAFPRVIVAVDGGWLFGG